MNDVTQPNPVFQFSHPFTSFCHRKRDYDRLWFSLWSPFNCLASEEGPMTELLKMSSTCPSPRKSSLIQSESASLAWAQLQIKWWSCIHSFCLISFTSDLWKRMHFYKGLWRLLRETDLLHFEAKIFHDQQNVFRYFYSIVLLFLLLKLKALFQQIIFFLIWSLPREAEPPRFLIMPVIIVHMYHCL